MKTNETTLIYNYLKNNIIISHTEILYFIFNNPYGITDNTSREPIRFPFLMPDYQYFAQLTH